MIVERDFGGIENIMEDLCNLKLGDINEPDLTSLISDFLKYYREYGISEKFNDSVKTRILTEDEFLKIIRR